MGEEFCEADFMEANLSCDMPPGHEGAHSCTFEWDNDPSPFASVVAAGVVMAGYAKFLEMRYGARPFGDHTDAGPP